MIVGSGREKNFSLRPALPFRPAPPAEFSAAPAAHELRPGAPSLEENSPGTDDPPHLLMIGTEKERRELLK